METTLIKSDRCLRVCTVADRLGIGVSTVWKLLKSDKSFPKPFKLSLRTTVWLEDDVNSYINQRARTSIPGGQND